MNARKWQAEGADALRSGDRAGAIAALLKAVEAEPEEPEFLRNLSEIARLGGDEGGAVDWMNKAAEATAKAPTVERLNFLSAGWFDLGRRTEALGPAVQALALKDNPVSRRLFVDAISMSPAVAAEHEPLLARALRVRLETHG